MLLYLKGGDILNNFKLGFSWIGLIIFILPMIINIIYAIFPPIANEISQGSANKYIELVEQCTRILYMISLIILVSKKEIDFKSPWLILAIIFLVLYYIVWIRYFIGGRDIALLSKSFLFVPMPLAVFPVLYFIFSAMWLHNYIAVIIMIIFGIAHNIVSYQSFTK